MQVNLSKNSWHAKYYKWSTSNPVKFMNLCPYFWSLVSLLASFPVLLFFKFVKFLYLGSLKIIPKKEETYKPQSKISKKIEAFNDKHEVKIKKVKKAAGLVLMWFYFGVIGAGGLFAIIFTVADGKWMELLAFIGGLALLFGLICLIIFGGSRISESDTYSMIKGMIKSKKDKICPGIEWKD
jgi:hypothetical protein